MTTTSSPDTPAATVGRPTALRAYSALLGLAALTVLLQGLWAGVFLEHDGQRDASDRWIEVHARGADVAIVLAALAGIVAFTLLRQRRDLWAGAAALTVLLVLESYLGGLVVDQGKDALTAVHVPLAMALVGLAVWLPLRVRTGKVAAEVPAVR